MFYIIIVNKYCQYDNIKYAWRTLSLELVYEQNVYVSNHLQLKFYY